MEKRADLSNPVILVGVDYSEPGSIALRRAVELTRGGTLHLVHVVDLLPAAPMPVATTPSAASLEEARKALGKHAQEQISAFAKENGHSVGKLFTHVAMGSPGVAIAQLAADLEADLIVVGTHGRRGFRRLLLGSVAESVIRLAGCPVFVERPKDYGDADAPAIEPPCPQCAEARQKSAGETLWCQQHGEKHQAGTRARYSTDRSSAFPSPHGGLGSVS
jgi:nucleotide-binding universal stress UspA family protein